MSNTPGDPLPPDSRVIVVRHPAAAAGVILGTWPTVDVSNSQVYADVIGMGTCTGWKKEQSYLAAASATETNGELQSYSSNRPDDQTTQDWSRISATGVGIHVDDCQAFLRFIRGFGGIANRSITEVCPVLHPEGMSAISRGLSARDTPGSVRTK